MSDMNGAEKLMALSKASMDKKKKGKQNNKKTKPKKQIITDFTDAEAISKAAKIQLNAPAEKPESAPKAPTPRIEKSGKIMAIVAATGTNIIDESDIRHIFNEVAMSNIVAKPGYFILEFTNEDERKKALAKNKTQTYNHIDILVDTYSEEDEYPKKPQYYDIDRYSSRTNYSSRYGTRPYSYEDSGRGYSDRRPPKTAGFSIGSKYNQAPAQGGAGRQPFAPRTSTPPPREPETPTKFDKPSSGAYVPPNLRK